ncbi:MAG: glutaredoxin domain-containing protein [Lagierella massiliensis]|nr:glutaredoxin domain-containing protein [Lagierella massiliensis]
MNIVVYGGTECPMCKPASNKLKENGIKHSYRDIMRSIVRLKEFLNLRDNREEFNNIKEKGIVGIPCFYFVDEDKISFDVDEVIEYVKNK